MLMMFLLTLGIYQDVINEDDHKRIEVLAEHPVHQIHEHSWRIRESKRHHKKFKMTISGSKSSLCHIVFPNLQLMIARFQINLGKNHRPLKLIKQVINAREGGTCCELSACSADDNQCTNARTHPSSSQKELELPKVTC